MSVKDALKLLRLETGMTQTDLAKRLNRTYLTVNRWENGKGFPSRRNANDILRVAKNCGASDECVNYLYDVLMPESKRTSSAASYGFPDIDREFLFQLADGSTNSIYVIEKGSYDLLYANRKAEKSAIGFLSAMGYDVGEKRIIDQRNRRCFFYFANKSEPCPFCPLKKLTDRDYLDKTITIPDTGRILHIHAKAAKMNNRDVYIIYLNDVTEKNEERDALYQLTNDIPYGVGIYNVYLDESIELAFMNTIFLNMIGEDRKTALLRNKLSEFRLIHPDDKQRLLLEIKSSIFEKRNMEIDINMLFTDKKYHEVHLHGKPINKDHEKFTFYCVFREKTL